MRKHFVEAIATACLFWLPIDLLYLYYNGGWQEPNRVVLVAELLLLYCLPVFAVWRFFNYLRSIRGKERR